MESAGLRHRHSAPASTTAPSPKTGSTPSLPSLNASYGTNELKPPKFTIDLSLPPQERYTHVTPHVLPILATNSLSALYTDLISSVTPSPFLSRALHFLSRIVFRRLYDAVETAELRGISRTTGLPMYLLVAFNVLLDLLLGCTSGGIRVCDETCEPGGGKQGHMVHFRTLDWGMDALRALTVELDFIRTAEDPERVVMTSITYFGYVGVLTGVRQGLSASLNFRPHHDSSTRWKELKFRTHQALVLLGWRRGISSVLREIMLRKEEKVQTYRGLLSRRRGPVITRFRFKGRGSERTLLDYILHRLPSAPSTAAYLTFCTPQTVYTIEKDHYAGNVFSSDMYLSTCNHDVVDESNPSHLAAAAHGLAETATGMETIVAFSLERKQRLDRKRLLEQQRMCRRVRLAHFDEEMGVRVGDVVRLVMDRYVSNDETHYSCVMDPKEGRVLWRRAFEAMPEEFELMDGEEVGVGLEGGG